MCNETEMDTRRGFDISARSYSPTIRQTEQPNSRSLSSAAIHDHLNGRKKTPVITTNQRLKQRKATHLGNIYVCYRKTTHHQIHCNTIVSDRRNDGAEDGKRLVVSLRRDRGPMRSDHFPTTCVPRMQVGPSGSRNRLHRDRNRSVVHCYCDFGA